MVWLRHTPNILIYQFFTLKLFLSKIWLNPSLLRNVDFWKFFDSQEYSITYTRTSEFVTFSMENQKIYFLQNYFIGFFERFEYTAARKLLCHLFKFILKFLNSGCLNRRIKVVIGMKLLFLQNPVMNYWLRRIHHLSECSNFVNYWL